MYQGPLYGIRQLVDVASQALSPAVNQPTTAVIVIDRLEELPLRIGRRPQPTGLFVDAAVVVRLSIRSPRGPKPSTWRSLRSLSMVRRRPRSRDGSSRHTTVCASRSPSLCVLTLHGTWHSGGLLPMPRFCRSIQGPPPVRIDEDLADDVAARGGQIPVCSVSGRAHRDLVGVVQGRWLSCES